MIADITVRATDLAGRVTLHEGTREHPLGVRLGPQRYRAGAFLPRGAPRPASAHELEVLAARHGAGRRDHLIGVVAMAPELVQALQAARRGEGRIDPAALTAPPFTALAGALAPHWQVRAPLLPLGYGHTPPGFHTVTFDAAADSFIGLHIDDLDEMPIAQRAASTARLCLNLGQDTRELLFVNLSATTMARELTRASGAGAGVGDGEGGYFDMRSTPLIHAFLRRFPDYPVVRLRVAPGEAYIAPTENMIHDGSTLRMQHEDLQVTLRGIIDPMPH
jgi:hypothetical protein